MARLDYGWVCLRVPRREYFAVCVRIRLSERASVDREVCKRTG